MSQIATTSTIPMTNQLAGNALRAHSTRVRQRLRDLGASWHAAHSMEADRLPRIIHPSEHIGGLVYGHSEHGYAMLLATSGRVLFLDVKPLFSQEDEITYGVISGLSYGHSGLRSTVRLHTKMGDYWVRTRDRHCAEGFVGYIEKRCLEANLPAANMKEAYDDYAAA